MNRLIQKVYLTVYNQIKNEEGQNLIEFALIVALVALGVIVGANNVASAVNTVFNNISSTLS